MKLESSATKLTIVEDGSFFVGTRVGVSVVHLANPTPALLKTFQGQATQECRAIRLVPRKEVPTQIVAIGSDLAQDLGLEAGNSPWVVTTEGFEHLTVQELLLELAVEQTLETAVTALNRTDEVSGTLMWLAPGEDI